MLAVAPPHGIEPRGGACSLKRRELRPHLGSRHEPPSALIVLGCRKTGAIRAQDQLVRRSRRRVKVAVWIFG